jgi:hypothetical protein
MRYMLSCLFGLILISTASSQLVTVGGGILTSNRPPEPVFELHAATPPFSMTRAYITLSWTESRFQPTIISAAERTVLQFAAASTGIGVGLLWLEANDYKPYPMLVSSSIIPLPVPHTSFVLIGSTLPFEDFDWSVVFKVGVTLVFIK